MNAALRKRLSGDLDGLGRPGSPRGRWIPPFGGRCPPRTDLRMSTILVGEAAQGSWAEGASALGTRLVPLYRPSDYSHQILSDRQNLVPP